MAELRYQRIMRAVQSTAWAIVPQRLADILDVLDYHARGGEKMSAEEIAEFMDLHAASKRPRVSGSGGVAVLGLRGIIANRIEQIDGISGPEGTSIEGFKSRLREAMASDNVGSVVIDVDSPGGSVDGVLEMAEEIRGMRGTKPIVAVANTLAASAAYWLASQADELVVTPSGEVGSIGVFAAHVDESEALAQAGEKVTLIHAGRYKVEGNPFEPLGDDARDAMQSRVNAVYEHFVEAVASGRGVTSAKVRNGFGEGRTVSAANALAEGMVDRVETLEATIDRLRGAPRRRGRVSPSAFEFMEPSAASAA